MRKVFDSILLWIINLILTPNHLGYCSKTDSGNFVVIQKGGLNYCSFYDNSNKPDWHSIPLDTVVMTWLVERVTVNHSEVSKLSKAFKMAVSFRKEHLIFFASYPTAVLVLAAITSRLFQPSTLMIIGLWSLAIFTIFHLTQIVLNVYIDNKTVIGSSGCLAVTAGYVNIITSLALGFDNWIVAVTSITCIILGYFDNVIVNKRKAESVVSEAISESPNTNDVKAIIKPWHIFRYAILTYPLSLLVRALPYIVYYLINKPM